MARPEDLTVDYKKLLRLSVSDRVEMARSPVGRSYLASLTPTQYNSLFPSYYKNSVPSYSAVSSGGGGGGMAPSLGGGGGEATTPSTPTTTTAATKPGWLQRFEQTVLAKTSTPSVSNTGVNIDSRGNVNKQQFYNQAVRTFKNSSLNGFIPADGKKYGIDGTPESWAKFAMRVAKVESNFNVNTTNPADPGGSFGLFQWGKHYGITKDNWKDPQAQLDAFVTFSKQWVVDGGGYVLPPSGVKAKRYGGFGGFGSVFSTVRNDKVQSKDAFSATATLEEPQFPSGPPTAATGIQKQQQQADDAAETPSSPMAQKQADKTIANMATGKIPLNERMLANAMSVKGMNENRDTKTLMEYFRKGGVNWDPRGQNHWCGVFVQTSLAQAGVQGAKGYAIASNWLNWGSEVNAKDVKPGDVLAYKYRRDGSGKLMRIGETGGHVGMATGKTKVENGVLKMEIYGGNQSDRAGGGATLAWVPASQVSIRRAPEFMASPENRERATALESMGLNPADAERIGKMNAQNVNKEVLDIPTPQGYENLPESLRKEIESLPVDQRSDLYNLMQKAQEVGIDPISGLTSAYEASKNDATAVVQTITEAPPGKIPEIFTENFEVLEKSREQLSREQRMSSKGKRIVSLDFNASPGGKGVEIVIPDDATDEERLAAEKYVSSVKKYFEDRGYKDYPIRGVRTTSENKRGVQGFFHTEPFFSTDKNAVDIISKDPAGYASVVASTLGSLPGTRFIPPHMETSQGAVLPEGISERQFALDKLIPELRKLKETSPDDAAETPLMPQAPTAEPVREKLTIPTFPSVDDPFQGIEFPEGMPKPNVNRLSPEYRRWASLQDRAELSKRISEGWSGTSGLKKAFASPDAVADAMVKKYNDSKSKMTPEQLDAAKKDLAAKEAERQKQIEAAKTEQTPAAAPTAEPPKQEQTPAAAPTAEPPKQEQTPAAAPTAEPPKQEEAPKAMATGGTFDIPPGENIAGVNMKTGKTEFYVNDKEHRSLENGKLKIDPATLVNDDVPSNAYVADNSQQQSQQTEYNNVARMTSSSAPQKADMSGVVNRFVNINPDTPSAMRHLAQTRPDPYRNGTNFNV